MTDIPTLDETVARVIDGLASAAQDYGPAAVDLGLLAVRIEAGQQLAQGTLAAIVAVGVALAYRKLWRVTESWPVYDYDISGREVVRVFGGAAAAFTVLATGVIAADRIIDISAWLAVFGYPEVRVAMKALAAIGAP